MWLESSAIEKSKVHVLDVSCINSYTYESYEKLDDEVPEAGQPSNGISIISKPTRKVEKI